MEHKYIPKFMVAWTFYAWKFVAGAFGKKVERPWREQLCGPFWLSLLGVTAGLPLVLLAYAVGSKTSSGIARGIGNFFSSRPRLTKALALMGKGLFLLALAAGTVAVVIIFVRAFIEDPRTLWAMLAAVAIIAAMLPIVDALAQYAFMKDVSEDSIFYDEEKFKKAERVHTAVLIVFFPLVVAAKILKFVGFMFYAAYKKFCPVVELE